jgi:hypothetical protein
MRAYSRLRAGIILGAWCVLPLLAACSSLSGKYEGDNWNRGAEPSPSGIPITLNFKSGDKVDVTYEGTTKETNYTIKGNQITIHSPNGDDLLLTKASDGTLTTDFGMKLTKQ